VHDNIIVLGDTAGLVNPVHGGGIDFALFSAKIASKFIGDSLKKNNKNLLKNIDKEWKKQFGKKLFYLKPIARFIQNCSDKKYNYIIGQLTKKIKKQQFISSDTLINAFNIFKRKII